MEYIPIIKHNNTIIVTLYKIPRIISHKPESSDDLLTRVYIHNLIIIYNFLTDTQKRLFKSLNDDQKSRFTKSTKKINTLRHLIKKSTDVYSKARFIQKLVIQYIGMSNNNCKRFQKDKNTRLSKFIEPLTKVMVKQMQTRYFQDELPTTLPPEAISQLHLITNKNGINIYGTVYDSTRKWTDFKNYKDCSDVLLIYNDNCEDYQTDKVSTKNNVVRPYRNSIGIPIESQGLGFTDREYETDTEKNLFINTYTDEQGTMRDKIEKNIKEIIKYAMTEIKEKLYKNPQYKNVLFSVNTEKNKLGIEGIDVGDKILIEYFQNIVSLGEEKQKINNFFKSLFLNDSRIPYSDTEQLQYCYRIAESKSEEQDDTTVFLGHILDKFCLVNGLEEERNSNYKITCDENIDKILILNKIDYLFGVFIKDILIAKHRERMDYKNCKVDGHRRILNLPVNKSSYDSIQEMITNFEEIEYLDEANKFFIEETGKPKIKSEETTKQFKIASVSKYLIISINIFEVVNQEERINTVIKVITITDLIKDIICNGIVFEIIGLGVYRGTGSNGHYVSYIKSDDIWYNLDDSKFNEIDIKRDIYGQPYVFLYRQKEFRERELEHPKSVQSRQFFNTIPRDYKRSPIKGIKNVGNTCYVNASLQLLLNVPEMRYLVEKLTV